MTRSIQGVPISTIGHNEAGAVAALLPVGAAIRHVAIVPRVGPMLWVEGNFDEPTRDERLFAIFATGAALPDGARHVHTYGEPVGWHIYELDPPPPAEADPVDVAAALLRDAYGWSIDAENCAARPPAANGPHAAEELAAWGELSNAGWRLT